MWGKTPGLNFSDNQVKTDACIEWRDALYKTPYSGLLRTQG